VDAVVETEKRWELAVAELLLRAAQVFIWSLFWIACVVDDGSSRLWCCLL